AVGRKRCTIETGDQVKLRKISDQTMPFALRARTELRRTFRNDRVGSRFALVEGPLARIAGQDLNPCWFGATAAHHRGVASDVEVSLLDDVRIYCSATSKV